MGQKVAIRIKRKSVGYDVTIGNSLLGSAGEWAIASLGRRPRKVLIVSNRRVFGLYGATLEASLRRAKIEYSIHLIGDGERFKNIRTLGKILQKLGESGIDRGAALIALGGGVVGDVAGFAASVHLRGIDLLQIPTTLLSMIDSSVGGKTGINTAFGKNLVGAFHQPRGVLIDVATLSTLARREITAGFCEAVKQGAISGQKLLNTTAAILASGNGRTGLKNVIGDAVRSLDLEAFLAAQVAFKASIVRADEGESTSKTDKTSRKILNFGHTFAHALEKVTDYRYLKHGEAVGHGILFAADLSKKLELLSENELKLLNDVVHRAGILPPIHDIDPAKVFDAFQHDKKVIGNELQWVLLNGIGNPKVVNGREIPARLIRSAIRTAISRKGSF